jgi:hypothetical protein
MYEAAREEIPLANRRWVSAGLIALLIALGGLLYYKWTGSIATVEGVRSANAWTRSADSITTGSILRATINYFDRVWIALVFGILIGATVRALISPAWVAKLLGRGSTTRRQIAGGLSGAPLMLCSCCVTPIFTSVYQSGASLGSALGMMLASPGLNVAALALTFMLFPLGISLSRLAAALAAVFIVPPLLERLLGNSVKPISLPREEGYLKGPRNVREFSLRFIKSAGYLTIVTVPLIAGGVVLSSLILPVSLSASRSGELFALPVIAAISVVVALPTFFEIPLGILLLQMGAPGMAAAMLFAGPIINMPSLLILAQQTNSRVSIWLAAAIWLLAMGAGLAASLA